MKQIKQFRYYGSKEAAGQQNYPNISNYYGVLTKGNLFASHGGISHLGIQAIPGTKFYLNNSIFPIMIGSTGIYELETGGLGNIFAIRFDPTTLAWYDVDGTSNRILIDIVFEGGV